MSIGDFLDEYFENAALEGLLGRPPRSSARRWRRHSPGTAYVLLHHYMGEVDGQIGAWGFARGGMGSVSEAIASAAREAGVEIRTNAEVEPDHHHGRPRRRRGARESARRSMRASRRHQCRSQAHLSEADRTRDLDAIDPDIHTYAKNFKIRGSSGKLNIALDGLPHFAGLPQGGGLGHHRYRRRFRLHRARLRRLQIRLLVEAAVPRLRDPDHGRSDHGPAGQAFHVGLRAVRALRPGRRALDAGDEARNTRRTCSIPSRCQLRPASAS